MANEWGVGTLKVYKRIFLAVCRQRPYHVESTGSRPITEVKQRRARLVLGWVTAWEHRVLLASMFWPFFLFFFCLRCFAVGTNSMTMWFFQFFVCLFFVSFFVLFVFKERKDEEKKKARQFSRFIFYGWQQQQHDCDNTEQQQPKKEKEKKKRIEKNVCKGRVKHTNHEICHLKYANDEICHLKYTSDEICRCRLRIMGNLILLYQVS